MVAKKQFLDDKWLSDPVLMRFADLPNVEFKKFFGGVAVYQQRGKEKVMLVFTGGTAELGLNLHKPEWRGLSVVTEPSHHAALRARCPSLAPHGMLKKWLFIADEHPDYATTLQDIYELAKARDKRLGVVQKPRKQSKQAKRKEEKRKKIANQSLGCNSR